MRAFDDLSQHELTELTDDQIRRYIDIACAEEGIALLPDPPTPPSNVIAEDKTCYSVGDLMFEAQDVAQRVADFVNAQPGRGTTEYISGPSYRRAWKRELDPIEVGRVALFSPERAGGLKAEIEAGDRAKKAYEDAKRAYDQAAHARGNVARHIRTTIEEAWDRRRRINFLREAHERYLQLAEGNRTIAARFLAKAYADARELVPEAFDEDVTLAVEAPPAADPVAAGIAEGDIPF